MNINEIYKKERIINSYFKDKYNYESDEIFNKQVLELLCELSEFAYETKCFKYWKNEKQSPANITVPELADCLMVTLCFCDLADIDEIKLNEVEESDMVKLFIETNRIVGALNKELDKNKLQNILSNLIKISKMLGYTDQELENYCKDKMNMTLKMIKNN